MVVMTSIIVYNSALPWYQSVMMTVRYLQKREMKHLCTGIDANNEWWKDCMNDDGGSNKCDLYQGECSKLMKIGSCADVNVCQMTAAIFA